MRRFILAATLLLLVSSPLWSQRQGYQPVLYLTQAQIDQGLANNKPGVRVIVVNSNGQPTGEVREGQASAAPTAIQTAANQPLGNLSATAAPAASNDSSQGYAIGSRWIDLTADESYICVDASVGAAVWARTTVGTIAEVSGLQVALDAKAGAVHSAQHASSGSDVITPSSIGAQAALVSAVNIRTVNGASLVGSGNVVVPADLPGGQAATAFDDGLGSGNAAIDRSAVAGETILRYLTAGSSTFIVPSGVSSVWVLGVGGGGGGGGSHAGGGGGGGRLVENPDLAVTPGQTFVVTVGLGGTGHSSGGTGGTGGGQSSLGSLLIAVGGGSGASGDSGLPVATSGGSGGGGSGGNSTALKTGAAAAAGASTGGEAPDTTGFGFAGGDGSQTGATYGNGAGGGGAGAVGANATGANGSGSGGAGGAGRVSSITGSSAGYAGGGGGGGWNVPGGSASHGGGAGAAANAGSAGTPNTGGGGGGSAAEGTNRAGGNGGSGIVIVRFTTQSRTYQALQSYADDTAAKSAGRLVGEFYRRISDGSVQQVQ